MPPGDTPLATVAAALARVHPHASHLDVLHVDGGAWPCRVLLALLDLPWAAPVRARNAGRATGREDIHRGLVLCSFSSEFSVLCIILLEGASHYQSAGALEQSGSMIEYE